MSEDEVNANEELVFKKDEIVKFCLQDFRENASTKTLILKCKVLSGDHHDKNAEIFITTKDNAVSKRIKAQFMTTFWTKEEIMGRQCDLKKLVGRIFEAKSVTREHQGKTFQNWANFHDLGPGAIPADAAPGTPAGDIAQQSF